MWLMWLQILFDYKYGGIQILFAKEQVDGLCGNMQNVPKQTPDATYEADWTRPSSVDSTFCSRVEVISYKVRSSTTYPCTI